MGMGWESYSETMESEDGLIDVLVGQGPPETAGEAQIMMFQATNEGFGCSRSGDNHSIHWQVGDLQQKQAVSRSFDCREH